MLYLLGPFHFENKMIVAETGHSCDGLGRILTPVEVDKGETLQVRTSQTLEQIGQAPRDF